MYFDSPIGGLAIQFEDSAVCQLSFLQSADAAKQIMTPSMYELKAQLQHYFSTASKVFTIPLSLKGTDFQQRVWHALRQIPAGETRTYGQLADALQSSPRAVGTACRRNPVPIIVPCHRVVSAQGLGGFCGQTEGVEISIKHWLLRHEGAELSVSGAA